MIFPWMGSSIEYTESRTDSGNLGQFGSQIQLIKKHVIGQFVTGQCKQSPKKILNNPSTYFEPFQFEITFEVITALAQDIEFKVLYVGSAEGPENDQVLESVMVGPVPVGVSKFVLEAPPPNLDLIPQSDIVGLTVMLLICSYLEKEFIRVGYYVNNDYSSEEMRENPPAKADITHIQRHILAEKPRVTRFPIPWDSTGVIVPIKQIDVLEDDRKEAMNIEV